MQREKFIEAEIAKGAKSTRDTKNKKSPTTRSSNFDIWILDGV